MLSVTIDLTPVVPDISEILFFVVDLTLFFSETSVDWTCPTVENTNKGHTDTSNCPISGVTVVSLLRSPLDVYFYLCVR